MAPADVNGRSLTASSSGRLARSKLSGRTKEAKTAETETVAEKPEIDELRRKRTAYYSRPTPERQRLSAILGARPTTRIKTSTVPTAKSVAHEHRKRRKQTSNKGSSSGSGSRQKTEDYVYSPAPVSPQDRDARRRSSDATHRSKHRSTASIREISILSDDSVLPEDSISQVGVNPASRATRSSSSRPLLQRTTTSPVKLAAISENANEPSSPPKSARKHQKRESSIFGSLLRRNSATAMHRPPRVVECLTCGSDDVLSAHTAKLSCGHRMCHECLRRIFEMSVKDPAHMPPRCCTKEHIPLKHVDKLFDVKFKVLWNRKYQEYHTKDRIYCPTPKCGEWIKPSHIHTHRGRRYAQCPRCNTKVCTQCHAKVHKSTDCPNDPEIAKLVAQAKKEGWQTCYNCHAMVELKEGCNHMTCRCLAEFCMICGSKWKTCECPWFNYRDLPDPDRLTNMRIPEEVRVVYRRVMDAAGVPMPNPPPQAPPRQRPTYNEEIEQRRRQERLDADLARRMQLGLLLDPEDEAPRDRHREANVAAWGLEGGHFMNDNFVANAANVVMSAFGDAAMGRRGDRESGRRRRARQQTRSDLANDGGLVPNFLGDESVLGVGPSSRPRRG